MDIGLELSPLFRAHLVSLMETRWSTALSALKKSIASSPGGRLVVVENARARSQVEGDDDAGGGAREHEIRRYPAMVAFANAFFETFNELRACTLLGARPALERCLRSCLSSARAAIASAERPVTDRAADDSRESTAASAFEAHCEAMLLEKFASLFAPAA